MPVQDAITIDRSTCTKCALCAEVCPNRIPVKQGPDGTIAARDNAGLCMRCGQCMAICPTRSILVDGLSYERDFFDLPGNSPDEAAFHDMIRTRRAVRNFKGGPVPKELLEKVVEAISFAPPSFPPLKYQIVVVQNAELIRKALPNMIRLYESLVKMMKNPVIRFFIKREVGSKRFRTMRSHLLPLLASRLPALKAGTEDTLTRNAPAMILFLADRDGEDIGPDIIIAAAFGMLAAHSMGLGGSIMDIIPPAIDRDPELRKMFSIPDDQEVAAALILGYPKYKYQRGIRRKIRSVHWLSRP